MSKVTAASTEASSDEQDDSFSPLMARLESAIHRLKLAAVDLGDLAVEMPAGEHGSAAFVVAETTEDLNQGSDVRMRWRRQNETYQHPGRDPNGIRGLR